MPQDTVQLAPMTPGHLDAALALSVEARWPHRREDWDLLLGVGQGLVALDAAGRVVGTSLFQPFGTTAGAISMVIVSERMRGHGIGRRLFSAVLALAGQRALRLTATPDGEPLYRSLGFKPHSDIFQRQGIAGAVEAVPGADFARAEEFAQIVALDTAAFGADRSALLSALAARGRFAVLRRSGQVIGFAHCRPFGRGELIGPVVVSEEADPRALLGFFLREREGRFVRVDLASGTGLDAWLDAIGLVQVDTGLVMWTAAPQTSGPGQPRVVTLAAQAVG